MVSRRLVVFGVRGMCAVVIGEVHAVVVQTAVMRSAFSETVQVVGKHYFLEMAYD